MLKETLEFWRNLTGLEKVAAVALLLWPTFWAIIIVYELFIKS